jgi:hypothetical protein
MRACLIIFPPPLFYQDLCFLKYGKDFLAQKLVPQFSIERLNVTIFPAAAWISLLSHFLMTLAINSGPITEKVDKNTYGLC